MPMMMSENLERRLGARFMQEHSDNITNTTIQCPPINPQLLAHLKLVFKNPTQDCKVTNPLLAQILTVQFGVEKVLHYMTAQYDAQSALARQENEV